MDNPMHRVDAYQMIRRRTAEAGFKVKLGCHVFRATGITASSVSSEVSGMGLVMHQNYATEKRNGVNALGLMQIC